MAQSPNPLMGSMKRRVRFNSTADDVYDIFRNSCHLFPRLMPDKIQKVELLKPEWNSVGSVRRWTFDDDCGCWKDTVTAIDDGTRSITWSLVAGEVPKKKYYSLKVNFNFGQMCEGHVAIVTVTYEKKNSLVAAPEEYMDFCCDMVKAAGDSCGTVKAAVDSSDMVMVAGDSCDMVKGAMKNMLKISKFEW